MHEALCTCHLRAYIRPFDHAIPGISDHVVIV